MKKDELAVLSQAILNEVEGYEFWLQWCIQQ